MAERADLRHILAEKVVLESVLPLVLWLPVSAILVWVLVGWGLRPLRALSKQIQSRQPDDLKAILEAACEVGSARNKFEAEIAINEAWKVAEKKVEVIEWSEEDARQLAGTARDAVPKKYFDDKAFKEIFTITEK